jgi:hypothetical protein
MLLEREQTFYWRERDKLVRPAELGGSDQFCQFIDILDGSRYTIAMNDLQLIDTAEKETDCVDAEIDNLLATCDREIRRVRHEFSKIQTNIVAQSSRPVVKYHIGDILVLIFIGGIMASLLALFVFGDK